jgi:hypothetical protein
MMRILCWIGVGLVLLLGHGPEARGQSSAASYFHEAAQQYVAGNRAAAQRAVEQGLEVAPSDPRLNALREKLNQQGEQPTGQQDSSATASGDRSQQNSDSSSSEASEEGDNSSPSSGNQGNEQSGEQNQSTAGTSQSGQQSGSFTPTDSSSQAEQRPRGGGTPRDTLSREQAERLLRALEGQERQLLRELRTRSTTPRSVEKDW